jgi:hypothetical protein
VSARARSSSRWPCLAVLPFKGDVSTLRGEAQVYALARCGVPRGWATAATLPVLLDGFEIEDEHLVMTETLFMCLVRGARALILRRGRMRWPAALAVGVPAGCAVDVRAEGCPCSCCPRRRAAARPSG